MRRKLTGALIGAAAAVAVGTAVTVAATNDSSAPETPYCYTHPDTPACDDVIDPTASPPGH